MHNFNEAFLKHSLRNNLFNPLLLISPQLLSTLFSLFRRRMRTELLLNVLLFSDLSRWEQTQLRTLLAVISEVVSEEIEQNRILLTYNPIMAIALGAEQLMKISNSKNIFRH